MSKKQKELIQQLQYDLDRADVDYQDLARDYNQKCFELYNSSKTQPARPTKKKKDYAGCVSLDFWPPSDWARLKLDKFAIGRYFQLCIGPVRIDFFEN